MHIENFRYKPMLCACNNLLVGRQGLTLNDLKNSIPDFAKDVKLNFSSLIINSEYDEELYTVALMQVLWQ